MIKATTWNIHRTTPNLPNLNGLTQRTPFNKRVGGIKLIGITNTRTINTTSLSHTLVPPTSSSLSHKSSPPPLFSKMIIFYDFPSKIVGGPYNPNTWKVRYTLNYKRIPYKTEWVEYTEIESKCKEIGIPPSGTKKDGMPSYTLPSIWDTDAKVGVSESYRIAEYLDKTFPNSPKVIIPGTEALLNIFIQTWAQNLKALWQFTIPATLEVLDHAPSYEYFRRTRSQMFGKDLKEVPPKPGVEREAALQELKAGLNVLDRWLVKSGGPFIMGDNPSFADFVVGGYMRWTRAVLGPDSKEWKEIASWNEGRWGQRVQRLDQYATVQ
ncbi:hypothetical protein AMATHDRAFT_2228 [Amanita thiersii Skay4041]|uniref:GST N-terminal domain-containing protein n=1 Tax=Amanita thiersii Skay4041 TaxID=703135 RepID=A0A2A9NXL0_9AGAR|nr:hypothetical protein AMATHDRAFT_2228 [Amanita thiersii Skay4041]